MKTVTKVVGMIVGALSSLFVVGCNRSAPNVYGPPPADQNPIVKEKTGNVAPEKSAEDPVRELKEVRDFGDEIYGPPEMLERRAGGSDAPQADDIDDDPDEIEPLPEARDMPALIYGPPEMFEAQQPAENAAPKREDETNAVNDVIDAYKKTGD